MNFLDLIAPNNILFELKADSKEEVIHNLVMFGVKNMIFEDEMADEIILSLIAREDNMSTGIGSGVAIPHCSISLVNELKVVIGLSREGIDFASIDHLPVNIFIVLIVPKQDFQKHIKTLALIAKTLNQKEDRDKLLLCNSYEEIVNAFKSA